MAKSINELFGIEFDTNGYIASAKFVVTEHIARKVKQQEADIAKCSKEISEKFPTVSPPTASDLSQIKKKFALYKSDSRVSLDFFNNKEIRSICYFANQIANNMEDYHILIYLIQKHWRQSYLIGHNLNTTSLQKNSSLLSSINWPITVDKDSIFAQ